MPAKGDGDRLVLGGGPVDHGTLGPVGSLAEIGFFHLATVFGLAP